MSIRIVIADDQAMVRSGFRSLLQSEPDLDVVADAADGAAAIKAVADFGADVVLMDIRMPVLDGLSATRQLVRQRAAVRVLMLTTFDLDEYVFEALQSGASGFLLKDATAEELTAAVRTVAAGECLLDPAVTRRVIEAFVSSPPPSRSQDAGLDRLSAREAQVLTLLARGRSNPEIAKDLFVSDATAKTHVSNVLGKLGLRDRVQAVIYAYEHGLVHAGRTEPGE